jgi:hypothetical protein
MSGKISLKPYYNKRNKRFQDLKLVLHEELPKRFPTVLIVIIVDMVMEAEDIDVIIELNGLIVDGMNNRVKHLWKKMVELDLDHYYLKIEPIIQIYELDDHVEFIEFLMSGGYKTENQASKGRKNLNIAQFICQQLYIIKTRNKYYYQDFKYRIYHEETYRKRYRVMCERDMDTVFRLAHIIDDIESTQDVWEQDPKVKELYVILKHYMPSYCEFWEWRKSCTFFMHNYLGGMYGNLEQKPKKYYRKGYKIEVDSLGINYVKLSNADDIKDSFRKSGW